ncbi:MAG: hypothetical protein V1743_06895 [Nanoarchaeota archaeon]
MAKRGERFGLAPDEAKQRLYMTIRCGRQEQRKKGRVAFHHYFPDNLTIRAICIRDEEKIRVLTVIMKRGRL